MEKLQTSGPAWVGKKPAQQRPINCLLLKSTEVLDFRLWHLNADVVVIRCEFLLIFWRFCNLSAVYFQEGGFLISEDENIVDSGSRVLGHFRGGREKGEICCNVVFIAGNNLRL